MPETVHAVFRATLEGCPLPRGEAETLASRIPRQLRKIPGAAAGVTRTRIVAGVAAPSAPNAKTICRAARRGAEFVRIQLCASLGAFGADSGGSFDRDMRMAREIGEIHHA